MTKTTFANGTIVHRDADGKYHREDGPAIIYPDGSAEWWVDGEWWVDVLDTTPVLREDSDGGAPTMTRTPQDAADEEMMAALERAGVDMNELARLSTDDGLFVVERDDLDKELVFQKSARPWAEGTIMSQMISAQTIWRWRVWGPATYGGRARLVDLGGGWEPDVASMVARVVAFLGMGAR